jgi:hypothetical protein
MSVVHRTHTVHSQTPIDWSFMAWALVTTAPAMSQTHIDAGRFAAWIHVLTGTKIFFIRNDEGAGTPGEPCTTDPMNHAWVPVVLRSGHKLSALI